MDLTIFIVPIVTLILTGLILACRIENDKNKMCHLCNAGKVEDTCQKCALSWCKYCENARFHILLTPHSECVPIE